MASYRKWFVASVYLGEITEHLVISKILFGRPLYGLSGRNGKRFDPEHEEKEMRWNNPPPT